MNKSNKLVSIVESCTSGFLGRISESRASGTPDVYVEDAKVLVWNGKKIKMKNPIGWDGRGDFEYKIGDVVRVTSGESKGFIGFVYDFDDSNGWNEYFLRDGNGVEVLGDDDNLKLLTSPTRKVEEAVDKYDVGQVIDVDWDGPSKAVITSRNKGLYSLRRVLNGKPSTSPYDVLDDITMKELEEMIDIGESVDGFTNEYAKEGEYRGFTIVRTPRGYMAYRDRRGNRYYVDRWTAGPLVNSKSLIHGEDWDGVRYSTVSAVKNAVDDHMKEHKNDPRFPVGEKV